MRRNYVGASAGETVIGTAYKNRVSARCLGQTISGRVACPTVPFRYLISDTEVMFSCGIVMTAKDNHIPKRPSNFDEQLDTALR